MPRLAQLTTPAASSAHSAAVSRWREDLGILVIILREWTITGPAPARRLTPSGEIEKYINILSSSRSEPGACQYWWLRPSARGIVLVASAESTRRASTAVGAVENG